MSPEPFRAGMQDQLAQLARALAQGMLRRGWKVGINVPEIQTRLGLPHSGVGWLDGRCVLPSGARLEASPASLLRVEPELALAIGEPPLIPASAEAGRRAIARVHPALEIVDYALPTRGVRDLIGHSMFHRATVLGAACPLDAARELGVRWPLLRVGAGEAPSPRADLVPRDLGALVAFVASYLDAFGAALAPGDLILSGSYLADVPAIASGDSAHADFGPLGAVTLELAAS